MAERPSLQVVATSRWAHCKVWQMHSREGRAATRANNDAGHANALHCGLSLEGHIADIQHLGKCMHVTLALGHSRAYLLVRATLQHMENLVRRNGHRIAGAHACHAVICNALLLLLQIHCSVWSAHKAYLVNHNYHHATKLDLHVRQRITLSENPNLRLFSRCLSPCKRWAARC